jgi:hypothetical protein
MNSRVILLHGSPGGCLHLALFFSKVLYAFELSTLKISKDLPFLRVQVELTDNIK